MFTQKNLHTNVYSSFVYNSQTLGRTLSQLVRGYTHHGPGIAWNTAQMSDVCTRNLGKMVQSEKSQSQKVTDDMPFM